MKKMTGVLLLSFLTGCTSLPTKEELASLDYGSCPRSHEAKIRESFQSSLLVAYAGEPIIWSPRKYWYKAPPLEGGKLYVGYLVPVMVEQTRGAPLTAGKQLYGLLFRDNELVKKLDPMQMRSLAISEAIGPLPKDERGWKVGHSQSTDNQSIVEWVLPEETVQNWSELITVQYLHRVPMNMTPEKLAKDTAEALRKSCADVSLNILASSQMGVLYERKTASCAPMRDEYTIGKLIRGPRSMISVSYAKTAVMGDAEKMKWTEIVGQTELGGDCPK